MTQTRWLPPAALVAAFHAAWWTTALAARAGLGALALLPMSIVIVIALVTSARRVRMATLIVVTMAVGALFDGALMSAGALRFSGAERLLPPAWMVALWAGFAAVLPAMATLLSRHLVVTALLGAVLGPISYAGGAALDVLVLEPARGAWLVAVEWSVALPLLAVLADRLRVSSAESGEVTESRLGRRLRTIPRVVLLAVIVFTTLPALLALAVLVDVGRWLARRAPFMTVRLLGFLVVYLAGQLGGLCALFVVWLAAGARPTRDARLVSGTFAIQQAWAAYLLGAVRSLFRLHIVVEGDTHALPGPVLVFVRHASIVDTLLPSVFLSRRHGLRLRFVLKVELLEDPSLDVAGLRLPNHFVRRSGDDSGADREAVRRLASDLDADEGVLIYPEGTRFSRNKRTRALERLHVEDPEMAALASSLHHVLPLRPGGALALLEGAPQADLVFFAHTGLEGSSHVEDIWSGALLGRTVAVRIWRVPRAEVPLDAAERVRFLYGQWARVDAFIESGSGGDERREEGRDDEPAR